MDNYIIMCHKLIYVYLLIWSKVGGGLNFKVC